MPLTGIKFYRREAKSTYGAFFGTTIASTRPAAVSGTNGRNLTIASSGTTCTALVQILPWIRKPWRSRWHCLSTSCAFFEVIVLGRCDPPIRFFITEQQTRAR